MHNDRRMGGTLSSASCQVWSLSVTSISVMFHMMCQHPEQILRCRNPLSLSSLVAVHHFTIHYQSHGVARHVSSVTSAASPRRSRFEHELEAKIMRHASDVRARTGGVLVAPHCRRVPHCGVENNRWNQQTLFSTRRQSSVYGEASEPM